MSRFTAALILILVLPLSSCAAADFERDAAPVLIRRCLECHKGSDPSGGLSFESREAFLKGGDSGPVVLRGQPAESLLLQRVHDGEMPPAVKGVPQPLPRSEAQALKQWISDGAQWPEGRTLDLYEVTTDIRGGRDWWSFQEIKRPKVPHTHRVSPIDAFVRATLTREGMVPAPPAAPRQIIRRMYYSVTGLPPSSKELADWEHIHQQTGHFDDLIDHLLASPHFGERWARYWLDVVRYAESSGYERDQPKPFAWKYRDWVVNAINTDMPLPTFIRHQLAGDEVPERTEDSVIATGFLRLGTWNDEPNDDADYQYERLEDMVHATSSAFLGLTVKCARCHDHKFDPIPQEDYYRMASAFWAGPISGRRKELGGPTQAELGLERVLGWTDISATPKPLHVLKNGERDKPLHEVIPASLTYAPHLARTFAPPEAGARTTKRRLQLAEWISDKRNPLPARVFVNRIWQNHFGQGLVRSPNNFGFRGQPPTHPQLLDWLAAELIESKYSAKRIHRLILQSQTWQQSVIHPMARQYSLRDSGNNYWWRAERRRLDAEALRDSLLAATGEIDLRVGGEGFKPTISSEALEGFSRKGAVWTASPPEEQKRRSLYIYVSRSLMPPMMTTFDQCDTTLPSAQRDVTTVAPQALAMMNNQFVHDRSEALAARVRSVAQIPDEQIEAVWRFALGRSPDPREHQLASAHLREQQQRFETAMETRPNTRQETPILHVSADTGVSVNARGQVTQWKSRSGSHVAAQKTASAQPQLVKNVLNDHPVIRFDGQGKFLKLNQELLTSPECTILAVVSDTAAKPGLREVISNWNRSENVTTSIFLGLKDTDIIRFSDQYSTAGTIQNRQKHFLLAARNGGNGASIRQNGRVISSRAAALSDRRLGTEWVIGQQGNINGEFWTGDMAEIMVFDSALTDDQLNQFSELLSVKYGLSYTAHKTQGRRSPADLALASLCHVLLNSNEFLYAD